jgi:hypothetical protein
MEDLKSMSAQELFDLYYTKSWELVKAIHSIKDELPEEITSIAALMIDANDQRLSLD